MPTASVGEHASRCYEASSATGVTSGATVGYYSCFAQPGEDAQRYHRLASLRSLAASPPLAQTKKTLASTAEIS